jgi:hypothetical protein
MLNFGTWDKIILYSETLIEGITSWEIDAEYDCFVSQWPSDVIYDCFVLQWPRNVKYDIVYMTDKLEGWFCASVKLWCETWWFCDMTLKCEIWNMILSLYDY